MQRTAHALFLMLLIALIAAQPAAAYEYPLSPGAIRDAYFLGKSSASKREAFFAQYTEHFRRPKSGPYISLVRVITPFAFVAERTARMPNLRAPDAQQKFYGRRIALRVRVHIDLTPTYGWQVRSKNGGFALRSPDFWREFDVRLIQRRRTIQPLAKYGAPDYAFATEGASSVLVGADINLQYDPADVRSAPATIVVSAPDGQQIVATFDLSAIR
jgi:hypothetical protein